MRLRGRGVQVFSFVLVRAKNGFVWYLTVWAPNGGRLAGGSACPTRLHLTPWWHGGEARIGRAGRKLLTINGIKSWSLGTGFAERYGVTSDERRAIVNLPSCRPAKRCGNGVLDGHGIRPALRSIENLETYHVAAGIVVQDDAGLILIAFRDRRVAQQDAEDVHFGVVYYFHSTLQYFSILLVR